MSVFLSFSALHKLIFGTTGAMCKAILEIASTLKNCFDVENVII
jgi:hypothetical protein